MMRSNIPTNIFHRHVSPATLSVNGFSTSVVVGSTVKCKYVFKQIILLNSQLAAGRPIGYFSTKRSRCKCCKNYGHESESNVVTLLVRGEGWRQGVAMKKKQQSITLIAQLEKYKILIL